ncbi:MAG TPA: sugar transferase [Thermodesulfobacteriota bacterium]|nr:sugar transferase [Thermodesulfobacteriota bacterium]
MYKEDQLRITDGDIGAVWDTAYSGSHSNELADVSGFNHKAVYSVTDTYPAKLNGSYDNSYTHGLFTTVRVREYSLKRYLDIAVSLLGLIFSFPISIIIALAIWLEDGWPIFYCSERVGLGGRFFRTYKFRTMVADSDVRFGPLQAGQNDKRITRVGRVLRATAMDEIPQLWNVLKGDMSIVGPRALLPAEIEVKASPSNGNRPIPLEMIPGCSKRHSIRPGLTGVAQIYAPRDISRRQKFRYDFIYLRRQCLEMDLRFILLSLWITLRAKWESRGNKL